MARTKKTEEVKVVKGSHLTVTTHPNGQVELEWDDDALLRDVQDAIKAYEATQLVGDVALGKKTTTRTRKTTNAKA